MSFGLTTTAGERIAVHARYMVSPEAECDFELSLGEGHFRPGLINAHDHLHRNHYPQLGTPPYRDVYEWGTDLHTRFGSELSHAKKVARRDALLFGALKNLIGGVTTVVHHDAWEPLFDESFPVNVIRLACTHSLRLTPDLSDFKTQLKSGQPFSIHLAEGSSSAMAAEVRELQAAGLLDDRLIAVHVVGVDDLGVSSLRAAGAAVVWCPSSNVYLYERTAPASLLAGGVDVLIGTDALLSGQGTILRELRVARRIGMLSEERLQDAVGKTAAERLGLDGHALTAGSAANIVFLRRRLEDSTPEDVGLVIVNGLPRLADVEYRMLFEHCGVQTELLDLGRLRKLVVRPLARVAKEVVRLSPTCGRIFDEQ